MRWKAPPYTPSLQKKKKSLLLLRPKFKEVLRVKEKIMRDLPKPKCFTCNKQVERIEWLSFWDSWGACLPSTTTLSPEKRVCWGARRVNGPVPRWVTLNGHKLLQRLKNHVVPAQCPHMCTNTHLLYRCTQSPHLCSPPSHWVIFTQVLSTLIGADECLIGSFFTTPST